MKRLYILSFTLCFTILLSAQVQTENYVKTIETLDNGKSLITIQYYDGLGRPFETVLKGITPNHDNLISLKEYDGLGRDHRQWLPAVSSQDFMPASSASSMVSASHCNESHAFTEILYDNSPLNRITCQKNPGDDWSSHPISTEYLTNNQQMPLACIDYSVDVDELQTGTLYESSTLRIIKTTDEGGHVSYTFKDLQDRKVLDRHMDGEIAHDTYYVYDLRGDLRFVLQPMYQDDADLGRFAFQYRYDDRHNVIWKKLPGCEPVSYAYDLGNRLILSQDGRQHTEGKATFMLYDNHNRMVVKGTCDCTTLPNLRASVVNACYDNTQEGICSTGYISNSLSIHNPQAEATYYYDDYRFVARGIFTTPGMPSSAGSAHGLLTGEITSFADNIQKTCAVYRYDEKGRQVKAVKCNILNGIETTTTTYSLTDKPLTMTHMFRLDGKITTELQTFTYDHADRLLTQTHSLDNLPQVTLTENSYDNLCRLSSKRVMGEQISYNYNIRDWLTAITSPHYSQAMTYNLDGNMNAMQWRHDSATTPQGYNFSYDGLSRLKQAVFTGGETPDEFSTHYAYDLNGNITELYRNAPNDEGNTCVMDELTMAYNGNQLLQVDNNSDDDDITDGVRYSGGHLLTYDENGCLTKDLDKNISSIQYNSLNLPTYMRLSTASASIRYQYDSKGNKLQETRISRRPKMRHETSYCGNFVFENKVLKRILVDGGFIYFGENDTTYHYFLKDHLGSNRAVVNQKTGQVVEKYDYYPFGKQHGDYHTGYIHPYRYNGKEMESMMGIDWLYYGARMMEPEWGRFTTPDPMAEKYYHISPYVYCLNNPIKWIDKKGEEPGDPFLSPDAAARDFGMIYNLKSIETNREYGSLIYKYQENGKTLYSYNEPNVGKVGAYSVIPNAKRPRNSITYGDIHTHGSYNGNKNNNNGEWNETWKFSDADKILVNKGKLKASYLCTPEGKLMKYKINEKGNHCLITFNVDLPSDVNSPNHNSNTTASIKEKQNNENFLNELWTIISNYLK